MPNCNMEHFVLSSRMHEIIMNGEPNAVEISACLLHTIGEFSGNLDFVIRFEDSRPDFDTVEANLRMRQPDGSEIPLKVAGWQDVSNGFDVTVYPVRDPVSGIDFYWREGEVSLGRVPVTVVDKELDAAPGGPSGCFSAIVFALTFGLGGSIWFLGRF